MRFGLRRSRRSRGGCAGAGGGDLPEELPEKPPPGDDRCGCRGGSGGSSGDAGGPHEHATAALVQAPGGAVGDGGGGGGGRAPPFLFFFLRALSQGELLQPSAHAGARGPAAASPAHRVPRVDCDCGEYDNDNDRDHDQDQGRPMQTPVSAPPPGVARQPDSDGAEVGADVEFAVTATAAAAATAAGAAAVAAPWRRGRRHQMQRSSSAPQSATFGRSWRRMRSAAGGGADTHDGSATGATEPPSGSGALAGAASSAASAPYSAAVSAIVGGAPSPPLTALTAPVAPPRHGARIIPPVLVGFTPLDSLGQDREGNSMQQAGGHRGTFMQNGAILYKKAGERERQFYAGAKENAPWLSMFLPRYYPELDKGDGVIPIENLVYGMHYPCVLDLKLGTSTVEDDETSLSKRVRMGALDHVTTSKSAGVRLEGMSMYRVLEHAYLHTSKLQSHVISASVGKTLSDVLRFFLTDESGFRTDIALRFYSNLELVLERFKDNHMYRFVGSSILLIYDNDNQAPYSRWARALEKNTKLGPNDLYRLRRRTRLAVRVVDFAHIGPLPAGQELDEGFLMGLNSILSALRTIIAAAKRQIFTLTDAVRDAEEYAACLASSMKIVTVEDDEEITTVPRATSAFADVSAGASGNASASGPSSSTAEISHASDPPRPADVQLSERIAWRP